MEIFGLLVIPGCAVIALVTSDEQQTELVVPHVTLLTNDWFSKSETNKFVENVCTRGTFRKAYSDAKKGQGTF